MLNPLAGFIDMFRSKEPKPRRLRDEEVDRLISSSLAKLDDAKAKLAKLRDGMSSLSQTSDTIVRRTQTLRAIE